MNKKTQMSRWLTVILLLAWVGLVTLPMGAAPTNNPAPGTVSLSIDGSGNLQGNGTNFFSGNALAWLKLWRDYHVLTNGAAATNLTAAGGTAGQVLTALADGRTAWSNSVAVGGGSTTAASATADGYLLSNDWSGFNAKQDALGFNPATNSLAGILFALGYTPPTNSFAGITNSLKYFPATNTLAGILSALGYTPPTNNNSGIVLALGFNPATNTLAGIAAALGYTPATNSSAGLISALGFNPATNTVTGILFALGYTPPTNSFAGITNSLKYFPATNSLAGIAAALGYTPATNTLAGIAAALGYTPQPGSLTLSNLMATGAFTNGLAAGSGVSFVTNSGGIITISASAGSGGAADSLNPSPQLNGAWPVQTTAHFFMVASTNVDGNLQILGRDKMSFSSTVGGGLTLGSGFGIFASTGAITGTLTVGGLAGSSILPEIGLSLSDNTTLNSSTVKHGFLPKLSGAAETFLNGVGEWSDAVATKAYVATNFFTKNTRFVDANGSDTNDGTFMSPWATVQRAQTNTPAGWTIAVAPGTYAGLATNFALNWYLNPSATVTFQSDGSGAWTNIIAGEGDILWEGALGDSFNSQTQRAEISCASFAGSTTPGHVISPGCQFTIRTKTFSFTGAVQDGVETASYLHVYADDVTLDLAQDATGTCPTELYCHRTCTFPSIPFLAAGSFVSSPQATVVATDWDSNGVGLLYWAVGRTTYSSVITAFKLPAGTVMLGLPLFNGAVTANSYVGAYQTP